MVLLVNNAHFDVVNFQLPAIPEGDSWEILVDTNAPNIRPASHAFEASYALTARSMVAFGLIPQRLQ
jgi:glycogen operon protein